jgi:hypothetical protein
MPLSSSAFSTSLKMSRPATPLSVIKNALFPSSSFTQSPICLVHPWPKIARSGCINTHSIPILFSFRPRLFCAGYYDLDLISAANLNHNPLNRDARLYQTSAAMPVIRCSQNFRLNIKPERIHLSSFLFLLPKKMH